MPGTSWWDGETDGGSWRGAAALKPVNGEDPAYLIARRMTAWRNGQRLSASGGRDPMPRSGEKTGLARQKTPGVAAGRGEKNSAGGENRRFCTRRAVGREKKRSPDLYHRHHKDPLTHSAANRLQPPAPSLNPPASGQRAGEKDKKKGKDKTSPPGAWPTDTAAGAAHAPGKLFG